MKFGDYYHISLDTLLKEDSGMKEYLEKKSIEKSIRPISRYLLYCLLSIYFISHYSSSNY